ncbi:MAG: adenine phosphoribosyltransferase [Flavobacteriales bacterium AspAUS03]
MFEEDLKKFILDVLDFPKAGVVFKDIGPLLGRAALCRKIINVFCYQAKGKVDAVCGIGNRGFLFGPGIAQGLDVPFVMVRKCGKLPGKTIFQSYQLEYGEATVEISENSIQKGWRMLIHDDILATGGTAEATAQLLTRLQVVPTQFSFLIELNFLKGREKLLVHSRDIVSLITY